MCVNMLLCTSCHVFLKMVIDDKVDLFFCKLDMLGFDLQTTCTDSNLGTVMHVLTWAVLQLEDSVDPE